MLLSKLGALVATMAVEYRVVADLNVGVDVQVLDDLKSIFIRVSLTDVTYRSCIKPLYFKLELANPEGRARRQFKRLLLRSIVD